MSRVKLLPVLRTAATDQAALGNRVQAALRNLVGITCPDQDAQLLVSITHPSHRATLIEARRRAERSLRAALGLSGSQNIARGVQLWSYQGPDSALFTFLRGLRGVRLGATTRVVRPMVARPPVPGALPPFAFVTWMSLASLALFMGVSPINSLSEKSVSD